MTVPLVRPVHRWHCPACRREDVTHEAPPAGKRLVRMHPCPKLRGLTTPMLPAGTKAKIEIREREDYVGTEMVQVDPERGRPVQSLITTRDTGQDTVVFAPTATLRGDI